MRILVLNSGSSSVKYKFFDTTTSTCLAEGQVERIGLSSSLLHHRRYDGDKISVGIDAPDHGKAIECVIATLLSPNHGVITDRNQIDAIGHRVAHGGENFTESVLITNDVYKAIHQCIELAPLHNPHNIRGIDACSELLPNVPQVAVFDTAFHHTIPPHAYIYAIPYVLYRRYGIRRYGFHGTSHRYVAKRVCELMKADMDSLKIITCHLGNGCSIAAIKNGKSVDTSMGFTPLEGLVMGTRCGDIDPALILYVMGKENLTVAEISAMLNKHSGLIGISGLSSDMREIESEVARGNERAKLALDVFTYRIRKYIGAYAASMGGLDVIVFTGGIGSNSSLVREKCLEGLEFLGVKLDHARNSSCIGCDGELSESGSRVKVFAALTNEELMIALDTENIVSALQEQRR
ncbi:MAG: acetate/propionate family kinase [bacterium]